MACVGCRCGSIRHFQCHMDLVSQGRQVVPVFESCVHRFDAVRVLCGWSGKGDPGGLGRVDGYHADDKYGIVGLYRRVNFDQRDFAVSRKEMIVRRQRTRRGFQTAVSDGGEQSTSRSSVL